MANRLARESSPYLLQHAENPVDWHPWGTEAFDEARRRDVPVLLSIGYSACHWCHVMERESFEDATTAELMNESFVSIKVDREERPDIDSVYMKAVQAMTGQGGWPLTAFLTSDGEPFFGGTYFPPEPRPNMPSFRQILESIRGAYGERREEIVRNAGELKALLEKSSAERSDGPVAQDGEAIVGLALLDHAFRFLASRFDAKHGGFGGAPKFPQPVTLEFALRVRARTGDPDALEMVTQTLSAMARGGIHDHLAGGFHRYSVDARWLVPHFEKMLYDNALLGRLYLNAYQVTGDPELRRVAEGTLDHLLNGHARTRGGILLRVGRGFGGRRGDVLCVDAGGSARVARRGGGRSVHALLRRQRERQLRKKQHPPPSPRPRRRGQARGCQLRGFARAAPGREACPVGGPKPPRAAFPRREDPCELERNGDPEPWPRPAER